jgi:hypothetical protein
MLQRAHEMLEAGDYAGASAAFLDLARGAEERFPGRAPFLFIQAGLATVFAGQSKNGVEYLRRGLTILASQGRIPRMRMAGQRIMDELKARGFNSEADEIAALLNANTPQGIPAARPVQSKRATLPTHCPSCGAAVRADEVEWIDDLTAECDYCGSPVRGE